MGNRIILASKTEVSSIIYVKLASCVVFAEVMLVSRRSTYFSSIHSVNRKTYGEIFLPLGEAIAALVFLPNGVREFQYGVLVMGLSDPIAGLIGEKFGRHELTIFGCKKSLEGSCAFFVCTLLVTFLFFPFLSYQLIVIPIILAFVEFMSGYGTDNLLLPITGAYLLSSI